MIRKNRQTILVVITLAAVGLLAADRLLISPLSQVWQDRARRISALEGEVTRGQSLLDRATVLSNRWQRMKEGSLPSSEQTAESQVLNAVQKWRTESGLALTSIQPDWRTYDKGHQTLQCQASGQGSLREIARFLYGLETEPLALRIEKLEIAARNDNPDELTLNLRFSTLGLAKITP